MATMRSLGVHTPSALTVLISEGILPEDPAEHLYTWETYYNASCEESSFEETLTTEYCVVWSCGGIVKQIFNFEVEQQKVQQAVLTWFSLDEGETSRGQKRKPEESKKKRGPLSGDTAEKRKATKVRSRALVILLKLQALVYFLDGASHVVNLPFEVEKAFPAPRGLILQRKVPTQVIPATPTAPSAPNNSFFSPVSTRPSQLGSSLRIDPIPKEQAKQLWPGLDFNLLRSSAEPIEDTLPRHYTFTDPLAEMGLIVQDVPNATKGRLSIGRLGDKSIDSLDRDEEIIYVSAKDELPGQQNAGETPLILVVTANYVKRIFSVWYGSYIGSKPVSSLFATRPRLVSGAKSRRRSSFVTTGASTPGSER